MQRLGAPVQTRRPTRSVGGSASDEPDWRSQFGPIVAIERAAIGAAPVGGSSSRLCPVAGPKETMRLQAQSRVARDCRAIHGVAKVDPWFWGEARAQEANEAKQGSRPDSATRDSTREAVLRGYVHTGPTDSCGSRL